jgi:hypothetical protein
LSDWGLALIAILCELISPLCVVVGAPWNMARTHDAVAEVDRG